MDLFNILYVVQVVWLATSVVIVCYVGIRVVKWLITGKIKDKEGNEPLLLRRDPARFLVAIAFGVSFAAGNSWIAYLLLTHVVIKSL